MELAAAGVTVTDDTRNVSPPCAIVGLQGAEISGACAVEYTVEIHLVAPGPGNADAMRWLWTVAAPPLFRYAGSIVFEEWNDYPALTAVILEGGHQ